jgi:hypothetical protein
VIAVTFWSCHTDLNNLALLWSHLRHDAL